MKRTATLLLVLGLLAVGISASAQAQIIDPNVGFCTPPASAAACQGQPETDPTASGGAIGMWAFGSNDSSGQWYLILAIPDGTYTSSTAPILTTTSFNSGSATSPSFLPNFTSSSCRNHIYPYLGSDLGDLSCPPGSHRPHHGGPPNNPMNTTNMFGPLEQDAFAGIPSYFELAYTFTTPDISGNTVYAFTGGTALPAETFIAAITNCRRPKPKQEPVCDPVPEPTSLILMSSGLMLLAGVLRRRFVG